MTDDLGFDSPQGRPDVFWDPPVLLYSGYRGIFPGDKAAGALKPRLRIVEVYLHFPIRLHSVMLR
jgi:hypothetical protein